MLKFVALIVALVAIPVRASTQTDREGRIQITLVKGEQDGGVGSLFYQTQKYGLVVSGIKIDGFWTIRINLIGTALNLRSVADIIGTYTAVDGDIAIVGPAKTARLENPKGVVLEIQGVDLRRRFTLNLSGLTIKNSGWQP
jgi:hypothetical protein